jgi:hypothetical protein
MRRSAPKVGGGEGLVDGRFMRVHTCIHLTWGCLIDTATARTGCVAWWMWKEKKKSVTS